jgi:hypothetical protein
MRAEIHLTDEPKTGDFHPCHSLRVIADIRSQNLDVFEHFTSESERDIDFIRRNFCGGRLAKALAGEQEVKVIAQGLRTGRLAGTPGISLSASDIVAWDHLVNHHLIPHLEETVERLKRESQPGSLGAYEFLADNITAKKAHIVRTHGQFMEAFDEAVSSHRPSRYQLSI